MSVAIVSKKLDSKHAIGIEREYIFFNIRFLSYFKKKRKGHILGKK